VASVVFEHVSKRFGKVEAVRDLNLEIPDGEFMTFVGPSGCGKSTTLNMLAGLEDMTEGEIYIDGEPVSGLPAGDRDIAMVFQSYALYPHMNVRDNLAFALKVRHEPKSAISQKVSRAAEMLSIEELLDRKPRQLSGGQRQRVALGRALVREPRLFLLDEPLSNLDAKLRVQMRAELKLLFERLETTVVYVTHDQAEAMTLSDRVAIFEKGVIQQVGTPLELYNRPANLFVAGFLGSPPINVIEGQVTDGVVAGDGFSFPVSPGMRSVERGQRVLVGFRPEDAQINQNGEGARTAVTLIEPMGSTTILYAQLAGKLVALETDKATQLRAGAQIAVAVAPERLHFFDPATGLAISNAAT
jgi:multiple sugar transport system ATP-binding protein